VGENVGRGHRLGTLAGDRRHVRIDPERDQALRGSLRIDQRPEAGLCLGEGAAVKGRETGRNGAGKREHEETRQGEGAEGTDGSEHNWIVGDGARTGYGLWVRVDVVRWYLSARAQAALLPAFDTIQGHAKGHGVGPSKVSIPPKGAIPMPAIRRAEATWSGPLATGSGAVSAISSGVFSDLPVTWAARTEESGGKTSPEELVAAAHAACFSMQLSGALARAGTPPDRLEVSAEVTFDKGDAGWRVVSSALTVRGRVPGMSAADFNAAADGAKDGCPISQALKGNVALSVEATLED
jgi:osmotically inducible protein OsmC